MQAANADQKVHAIHLATVAGEHLRTLLAENRAIRERIESAKKVVLGLMSIYGEQEIPSELAELLGPGPNPGLTSLCRRVLHEAEGPITAREVQSRLMQIDRTVLKHFKRPVQGITVVMDRLVQYGEAKSTRSGPPRCWRSSGKEPSE